jgi:type IV pilus assembly protein PilX
MRDLHETNGTPAMLTPPLSGLRACGRAPRRAQEGLVLFIALIVLVAMTLAGVALMRAVDTGLVVAGNMAFKQSAIMVADRGTQEAVGWLVNNSAGPTLQSTNTGQGYFSSRPVIEPNWFDPASWSQSVAVNGGAPDASGNVVRYVIHRMCTQPDTPYNGSVAGVANECGLYYAAGAAASGGSMSVGAPQFVGTPQIYYRITTRVEGPRDTVSVIQTSVLVGI